MSRVRCILFARRRGYRLVWSSTTDLVLTASSINQMVKLKADPRKSLSDSTGILNRHHKGSHK